MRSRWLKVSLGLVVLFVDAFTYTFSANVGINSGATTEFGQGLELTVTCDTSVSASLGTSMDTATGTYFISSVTLSDLSIQLHDRTVKVYLLGADGSVLNSKIQFSVASDGLTYSSTRSHVDVLDAFTSGQGSLAELGANSITFNNLLNEEPSRIPASSFSRVNVETSGYGRCSTPTNAGAITLYVDAPSVQGSYIAEDFPTASLTDTYDSNNTDNVNCPTNGVVGTYSGGSNCKVLLKTHANPYVFGGALTTTSTPTTGGGQTNQSPSVGINGTTGETISFATKKNYIGFWWSAGSTGNVLKFYRGATLVASITGDEVYNAIPKNSSVLTAVNGTTTYTKSLYYGHPASSGSWDITEPFVYIHGFAVNGFNFDKVILSANANGFELDNLTVANLSNNQLTPKGTLVKIQEYPYTG